MNIDDGHVLSEEEIERRRKVLGDWAEEKLPKLESDSIAALRSRVDRYRELPASLAPKALKSAAARKGFADLNDDDIAAFIREEKEKEKRQRR